LRRIGADIDRLIVEILDGCRLFGRGDAHRRTERDRNQYRGGT